MVLKKASDKVDIKFQKERARQTQMYRAIKSPSPQADSVGSKSSKGSSTTRAKFKDRKFKPTLSEKSIQLS